jgi:CRISPR-associated endonuclease Csn1
MNNIFGADRWEGFSDKEKIEIWNLFNFFEKDEVKKCLYTKYNLDDTHLSYIDTAVLSDDYGSVSKKFIDAVMPFLENGYNHFTSTTFAGVIKAFGKRWSTFSKEQQDDILREIYNLSSVTGDDSTYMDRVSGLLSNVYKLKDEDLNKLYNHSTILQPRIKPIQPGEKINLPKTVINPAVNKVLFLIRKLISEIIEKYGSIEQINIEMARDFGLNKKAVDVINKKQKENAKTNQFLSNELLSLGVKDTTLNLKKMRLYKECGGICIYTGKSFTKEQLFNGEINLEHIVPYSIIPNNSIKNLALCYVDENLEKGNKTPFEFYSSNISKWKEVRARAKKVFNSDKYLHFISELKPDFQDFANRQLNDTRYIMTEVKDYLFENICSNIFVTTGEVTSKIRTSWGLNEILGTTDSKNTLDNRNHAVDAIVIAYTSLSIQRQILDLKRKKISVFNNIATPYDLKQLQRDITNIICNIVTKHQEKKRFKSSGTIRRNLHDSNPFGKLSNGKFVKRKAISSFTTPGSIKKIVDLQVRKSIEIHLLNYANEILANDIKIKNNPYINLVDLYKLGNKDFEFLCKKALSDKDRPVYLLNKHNVRGEIIKKARFSENSNLMSIGFGKTVKYVSPNNNELWIAEWIPEKDKYKTKTISCLELSKNYGKSFNNNKKNIILRINDMVLASQDINTNIPLENINKEILSQNIYRVQKTSEGILYLISHKEASVPNPKLENANNIQTIKIGTWKDIIKYNLRKLQIDNIGHIKTPGSQTTYNT